MARSSYIYLAMWGSIPDRAFTVKRELKRYVENRSCDDLTFWRLRDGRGGMTQITLEEILNG